MPKHSTLRQRVKRGLRSIPADRSVKVSLRDLVFVHQTLGEFIRFFHQPMHYPRLKDVHKFLKASGDGALDVLSEAYYKKMSKMLPKDIHTAFDEGTRFDHPLPPEYYEVG